MKIQINAELDASEVLGTVAELFQKQGIAAKTEDIKVIVWSEKTQKFIDFKSEQVKFIFNK
jgi:hypothetical protein